MARQVDVHAATSVESESGESPDESPPEGRRITGYRFQVTWLYVPHIPPVVPWESSQIREGRADGSGSD